MRVFCTYCSASKDPAKGLVPAFKRYISPRIALVQELAEREGAHFCILSGKFGLVDWNQPLPWYDHLLLPEEVPQLVEMVIHQFAEKRISRVDYYTRSPQADPKIIPYANTIEKACRSAGVDLHGYILEEPKTSPTVRNWKQIMEMAAEARQTLVINRAQGEELFQRLLTLFPDDGMVFFERAGGYEAIGELKLAKADLESAKRLFPLERWQWEAQEALKRIEQELAAGGTIAEARRRINNLRNVDIHLRRQVLNAIEKAGTEPDGTAVKLRVMLEILVDRLLAQHHITPTNELDRDIWKLKDQSVIPEIVANHMNTIRIVGNRGAHSRRPKEPALQSGDVYPSVTAFVAVLEWLDSRKKVAVDLQ